MLKLQPIEFFFRAIPEGFLFVLAVYIFSKTAIDKRKYMICSGIFAIIMFMIRLLPIEYGIHTILSLILLVVLTTMYNKIDTMKAMKSVLIIVLMQFIIEGINILILNLIPNINIDSLFKDPISKTLLGMPSLFMAYLVVYLFYLISKRKKNEYVKFR